MFDPAALALPSAPLSATPSINAIVAENAGNADGTADLGQAGGFEAMLALQSAQVFAPLPAHPVMAAILPASGKTLPVSSLPVAAVAGDRAETGDKADVAKSDLDISSLSLEALTPGSALPDPAMIAAIFAAPERLTRHSIEPQLSSSAAMVADAVPSKPSQPAPTLPSSETPAPMIPPLPGSVIALGAGSVAASVAIAQTTIIEIAPPTIALAPAESADEPAAPVAMPSQPATAVPAANRGARPVTPSRASRTADEPPADGQSAHSVTATPVGASRDGETEEALTPGSAQDNATPLLHRASDAASQQDAAPASRTGQRAERIDFATLVDTLNRAREEASPNTVRVAVAHPDFGRVSMRFEQDDNGLSVAMSSADPGFARAVSASNEATSASNDTARDQNAQSPSNAQARGGNGTSGEGTRQQQQGASTATPERPAAQLRDTLRRDDAPTTPGGIFA